MSRPSALLSGLTALVLVLLLGNPPVSRYVVENGQDWPDVIRSVFSFLSWDTFTRRFGDLGPATVVKLVLFVVVAAVLGGLAGRATRVAALIGGWGAGMAATTVGFVAYQLTVDDRFGASLPGASILDEVTFGISAGAVAGFGLAWTIALAVAIGAQLPPPSSEPVPPVDGYAGAEGATPPINPADGTVAWRPGSDLAPGSPPAAGTGAGASGPPAQGPSGAPVVGAPPERTSRSAPTPAPQGAPAPTHPEAHDAAAPSGDETQRFGPSPS